MGKVTPITAKYDAGSWSEYNGQAPASVNADVDIYAAGAQLRDWARYLAKNSSIVKACLDARVAKGIGTGLRYEPMVRDRKGNLLTKLNDDIKRIHRRWSDAADVTGELSREEIEAISWRDWDTAGEMFGRKVYRGRTAQDIGYQVQLLRSELVPYGYMQDGEARMGITRDDWGAPQTYWVYPFQQDTQFWNFKISNTDPKGIPADQIKHLRRQEESDQTRGVTLFHAVIFRASDIAEYQQSHRRAARASANLFASINREVGYNSDPVPPEQEGSAQTQLNLFDLQILDFLKEGESVNFHDPQNPNQNAVEFVNQELRQFASACRVAFSWIAYVFDRAYAAQRTELVHAWEMINEDRAKFIRDYAKPLLYVEPMRMAVMEGKLSARDLRRADPATLYDVRIEGPVMPSIDPVSDRKAAETDQLMGWESRQGNIRRFGRDPIQVDAERDQDPFLQKQEEQAQQEMFPPDEEVDNEQV